MTDTHTHVYEPEFDEDRDAVLARAVQSGVTRLLLPNINEESFPRMMAMACLYPRLCYPMVGLHPEDVKDDWSEVLDRMESELSVLKESFVAIGEVGLDFYWDDTYREQQLQAFERQVCWARDYDLPLVIHMRKAEPEILQIMKCHRSDSLRGIFHCFGGSIETARQLLKNEGFMLGIGGVVTFKKSHLPETLRQIPLERIVLETDAPYLAPVPYRGKRNEPSYVMTVAQFVSDVYNVPLTEVENVTESNVHRIFRNI